MKKSNYTHFLRNEKKLYAINLMTNSVLSFEKDSIDAVTSILDNSGMQSENQKLLQLRKLLYDNGFLINDDIQELELLKNRHDISCSFGKNRALSVQIAITLQCNFRCPYCYENHESVSLSQKKQDAFLKFISRNINNWDSIEITWFGGEPLLEPKIIDYMSKGIINICQQNRIRYRSLIVSNGYLLGNKNSELLKSCNVSTAQITIDGDKQTHDARRFLSNGKGSYIHIIQNILNAADNLEFIIRLNIDNQILNTLIPIFNVFAPIKDRVIFSFSQTNDAKGECIREGVSHIDFIEKTFILNEYALKEGFRVFNGAKFPGASYCPAYSDNSLLIDAHGNIHKCVSDTGKPERRMGYLSNDENIVVTNSDNQYKFDPFSDDDCRFCNVLPICMGGCPKFSVANKNVTGRCNIKEHITTHLEQTLLMLGEGYSLYEYIPSVLKN